MNWAPHTSQVESELAGLIGILQRENVTRFLEIGSRFGGSLWRIANALPKGSRIVSCDSGKGMGGRKPGAMSSLEQTIALLKLGGYDAHLVVGHSQSPDVVDKIEWLGPFDAVFIDGDHELDGVTQDWFNYGRKARKVAAFHDIGWIRPDDYDQEKLVRVPELWAGLKAKHRHGEFIDRSGGGNMGIGVLWL
jgi:hypothetical protein